MAYNLSKYKFQPGQRVKIIQLYGEDRTDGSIVISNKGVIKAQWFFDKGNTGTIVKVENYGTRGNSPPWIIVRPDPEAGFGEFHFTVKEVKHY